MLLAWTAVLPAAQPPTTTADEGPSSQGNRAISTQADRPPALPSTRPATQRPPLLIYRPPNRGAPGARVGGGTRGLGGFTALAPPHLAFTTSPQPRLYWFSEPGLRRPIRFLLVEENTGKRLLERRLPPEPAGGIHFLDLSASQVRLLPGRDYQWSVTLEPAPHHRQRPLVSRGRIRVVPEPAALARAQDWQRPFQAAAKGIWYDALEALSNLLQRYPADAAHWHLRRAELLEQGGLIAVAAFDREQAAALEGPVP